MKIESRVDHLEELVMKHLEESGEIRSDLKWLKKSYWVVVAAAVMQMAVTLWK